MPSINLCRDGIVADLERDPEGYWIVLTNVEHGVTERFPIDLSEIQAATKGRLTYQATNGNGRSISIEGQDDLLKIRFESKGQGGKQCRFENSTFKKAVDSLGDGV